MLALTAGFASVKAQSVSLADSDTVVVSDTVHYFFNKHYFKSGVQMKDFEYYKSAPATNTRVTHVGSKFENNEPIEINGLEAFMSRDEDATFPTVAVRLYLCTLQNNLPVLPALDSVEVPVTGSPVFTGPRGGKFKNNKVYTLSQDFAVLMRNASINSGDTILLMRTSGKTFTSEASASLKYSDGFGYVRYIGQFYGTRDFTLAPGFGLYNDYEFCVAPMVQYTLVSAHTPDSKGMDKQNGLCAWEELTYKSQSSMRFLHRQYNLIEFYRYWAPYAKFAEGTTADVFPNDSSVSWYFQPEDAYPIDPRQFLRNSTPNHEVKLRTDSAYYSKFGGDSIYCFPTNEYRTRFKSMKIYGNGWLREYNDTFLICTKPCDRVYPGLRENTGLAGVTIYPNPTSGKLNVTGISGGGVVSVYDLQGQMVFRQETTSEMMEIDLSRRAPGVYLVRITEGVESRTIRFIKN